MSLDCFLEGYRSDQLEKCMSKMQVALFAQLGQTARKSSSLAQEFELKDF